MPRSPLTISLLIALAAGPAAATAPSPRVHAASVDELARPLPLPYDEAADARVDVAAASRLARRQGKRLLIDLGGNWCPDCRVLAGIMALPEVRAFLDRHYVTVAIDIGRYDKNLAIAERYQAHYERGAPAVLIVDSRTGNLVNDGHVLALADARHMTPQALADWLAQWT